MRIDTRDPQLAALVDSAEPFRAMLTRHAEDLDELQRRMIRDALAMNNWAINRGNFWFLLFTTSAVLNLCLAAWLVLR